MWVSLAAITGRTVLLPAFRTDPRCEVVALAGTDAARTAELARAANVARGGGAWIALVEDPAVDAVAIAVPPSRQPEIARRPRPRQGGVRGKAVGGRPRGRRGDARSGAKGARPAMIDFSFPEIAAWRRARAMLADGAIGRLRHVVVTWNVENQATRLRLASWKTRGDDGGGVLGNFVSHCFHYLEWFCGPILGLNARVFHLPDGGDDTESGIVLALALASGAGVSLQMSCASFLGSGHRLEFYGEDGTLVLANRSADYMRGFELRHGNRSDQALRAVEVEDASAAQFPDGRIASVSRLARRFLDACASGGNASPGLQKDIARRS